MESPRARGNRSEVSLSVKLGNDGLDLLDHEGEVYFHFILSDGKLEGLHLRSKSKACSTGLLSPPHSKSYGYRAPLHMR